MGSTTTGNQNSKTLQDQIQHVEKNDVQVGGTQNSSNSVTVSGSQVHKNSVTVGGSESEGGSHSEGGSRSISAAIGPVDAATQAGYNRSKQPYVQSQQVTDAYNKLQEALNNKPGAFSSKYENNLSNLYDAIVNRKDFSYNMNNDAMYQIYKENYLNQGKNAMKDTVAASSALTGGYGNSYATTAGSQAYQNYLTQLNNIVPQLQQNAYNMYQDETSNLYNKANLTQSLYNQEYGRYRDTVNDWQSDRDYATNWYNNERNFDYTKYNNDRNYYSNEYWNQRNAVRSTDTTSWNDSTNWQKSLNSSWTHEDTDTLNSSWTRANSESLSSQWNKSTSDANTHTDTDTNTSSFSSTLADGYSGGSSKGSSKSGSSKSSGSADVDKRVATMASGSEWRVLEELSKATDDQSQWKGIMQDWAANGSAGGRFGNRPFTEGDYVYMTRKLGL